MRTIETRIVIDAAPVKVWEVLTATETYPEWNPFVRELRGELVTGSRIFVRIQPPGGSGMTFRPTVLVAEPGRELRWLGRAGIPGLFDGEHSFRLAAQPEGRTLFTHAESFRGILVPFMAGSLDATRAGFEAFNRALRDRVQAHARIVAG